MGDIHVQNVTFFDTNDLANTTDPWQDHYEVRITYAITLVVLNAFGLVGNVAVSWLVNCDLKLFCTNRLAPPLQYTIINCPKGHEQSYSVIKVSFGKSRDLHRLRDILTTIN